MDTTKRKVTAAVKKQVAGKQRFTCAGNVTGYSCPLNRNPFDEAGYEIDHIIPLSEGGSNDNSNLQALCLMCHRVKSNRSATSEKPKKEKKPKEEKKIKDEKKVVQEKVYYWPDDANMKPSKIKWKEGSDSLAFHLWRIEFGYSKFSDKDGNYIKGGY